MVYRKENFEANDWNQGWAGANQNQKPIRGNYGRGF
ncbi:MAG: hypothetical protein ACI8YQ_001700 [Polaribacter sp.]|jgi:hypothetical protein